MVANIGRRSALYATASGKVLLASQPHDVVEGYLGGNLKPFTSNTINDPTNLRENMIKVACRGYSTCWEDRELGLSSISLPVRNRTERVMAGLTIAAPASTLNSRAMSRFLVPLRDEAAALSAKLGNPSTAVNAP